MFDPLGLSIGTTNLVAERSGSPPVTRRAVLTLYPHCAPKVGVPENNPAYPPLAEPGVLVSGFVDRIGSSVALVSTDGSAHDPDLLMVEALDAMVNAVGADASSSEISIAVPAYWKPATVQALRDALRTHVGFVRSGMAPRLVSDAVATLTAVDCELGLRDDGVVGLLDFGGAGTSATLMKLGTDFEPVSATIRCRDFSGNEVDQALLLHVFEELGHRGDIDSASTEAVGRISHLTEQCRAAKERLSTDRVTELATDFRGYNCSIEITRGQLEDLIQDRLTSFIYAFDHLLVRSKMGWPELAGVVVVGGGASMPLVTHRLSRHARIPVLTPSQPELAAATGALLVASGRDQLDSRTRTSIGLLTAAAGTSVIELPAGDVMVIDEDALTDRELAWSQTEFPGEAPPRLPVDSYDDDDGGGPSSWSMRLNMIEPPPKTRRWRRFRFSQMVIGLCSVVAMTAIGGVAYTLTGVENREAPTVPNTAPLPAPPASSLAPSPVSPPPSAAPLPSAQPVPSTAQPPPPPPSPTPPPPVVMTTTAPPPVLTTAPHTTKVRPTPTATTPPTTTTTTEPTTTTTTEPTTTTTTTTTTTVPMTTEWLRIPLIPVPIPVPVPQNQAPSPQYPAPVQQYPQNPYPVPGSY